MALGWLKGMERGRVYVVGEPSIDPMTGGSPPPWVATFGQADLPSYTQMHFLIHKGEMTGSKANSVSCWARDLHFLLLLPL